MKRRAHVDRDIKRQKRAELTESRLDDMAHYPENYDCPEWCEYHRLDEFWVHSWRAPCSGCREREVFNRWANYKSMPFPPTLCKICLYQVGPRFTPSKLRDWAKREVAEWERKEKLYALRQCGFPLMIVLRIKKYLN